MEGVYGCISRCICSFYSLHIQICLFSCLLVVPPEPPGSQLERAYRLQDFQQQALTAHRQDASVAVLKDGGRVVEGLMSPCVAHSERERMQRPNME